MYYTCKFLQIIKLEKNSLCFAPVSLLPFLFFSVLSLPSFFLGGVVGSDSIESTNWCAEPLKARAHVCFTIQKGLLTIP